MAIGGVFLSSFITNFTVFSIAYPLLFGIGIGTSYMAPIISGWEYFPKMRGLVSGLIVLGFGFGSFIFGFISIAIANPDNINPTEKVKGGKIFPADSPISSNAPKMIRINCAIWLGLLLIALPLMRRKISQSESDVSRTPERSRDDESRVKLLNKTQSSNELKMITVEPTFKECLFDYRTLQIWAMMVLSCSFPLYMASNFKSYEQRDISDDQFITTVGSVGAVFNGLSRGFWSSLLDRFGFKYVYLSLLIVEIAISFSFVAVHKVKALFLIWM